MICTQIKPNNVNLDTRLLITNCLNFLQINDWILLILFFIVTIIIISKIINHRKQFLNENDITNMFDDNGKRSFFREHRQYDIITPIFFDIIIFLIWLFIKNF